MKHRNASHVTVAPELRVQIAENLKPGFILLSLLQLIANESDER
jgi:hypothetical protein